MKRKYITCSTLCLFLVRRVPSFTFSFHIYHYIVIYIYYTFFQNVNLRFWQWICLLSGDRGLCSFFSWFSSLSVHDYEEDRTFNASISNYSLLQLSVWLDYNLHVILHSTGKYMNQQMRMSWFTKTFSFVTYTLLL